MSSPLTVAKNLAVNGWRDVILQHSISDIKKNHGEREREIENRFVAINECRKSCLLHTVFKIETVAPTVNNECSEFQWRC
jgi:hypothetical protein